MESFDFGVFAENLFDYTLKDSENNNPIRR